MTLNAYSPINVSHLLDARPERLTRGAVHLTVGIIKLLLILNDYKLFNKLSLVVCDKNKVLLDVDSFTCDYDFRKTKNYGFIA